MIHIDLTLIVQLVLFLAFLGILNRFFYQPVSRVFNERARRIEEGVRAAEEAQRSAEETQREVRRRLEQSRAEAQGIIAAANKEASARRKELMDRARSEADGVIQQAQEEVRRERAAAVEQLRRDAGQIAILVASSATGTSLDNPANRAIADRAVAEIGGMQ